MANALAWFSQSGVVQGIILGAVLAFLTAILMMNAVGNAITTTVNGWSAIRKCGQPGNGVLVRAACAKALPVVNVFEEAAYWTTTVDSSGKALSGAHGYVMHFPAGKLPPHEAFWSLIPTDTVGYMVDNPTRRYSVGDRTPLAQNADGSVDIHLQHQAPSGREQNWLPIPSGKFKLMFRVYLPGAEILDGTYQLPPVVRGQ
ncbi:DUF1214 domain-containing protein [Arthrobacter bambusae]|uniref:DUF1214 domain-containing protein n=1 Tax=Arthrobacter bambusae TaxID=1338426 RepID=UPI0027812B01|nr:DUF1214 domain-containing protein [Arthrobacter bambusae]MDQ0030922.1 hypothetical protein [Arthrobacter bambusae]MDQ0099287.1 hypothetical protein [Arthrobacter bambusae]